LKIVLFLSKCTSVICMQKIQDMLVRMIRKPGPRQHLGLMGMKDFGRNLFRTFVGLMGKMSFEDQGMTTVALSYISVNLPGNI
uniref:Uncharacterized protein n=1 Tax=Monopterus albus TaxID=43700 RepID=A0A3Q3ITU5_MONAL